MEAKAVEVKRIELSEEEKSKMKEEMMMLWWATAVNAFIKTVGSEKAIETLGPEMFNLGKQFVEKRDLTKMVEGRDDATALAALVMMGEASMGVKGELSEVGEERVSRVNVSCPMSKCPPWVCQLIECQMRGMASVVAPEFTFVQEEAMTKGDPQCRWVVQRK